MECKITTTTYCKDGVWCASSICNTCGHTVDNITVQNGKDNMGMSLDLPEINGAFATGLLPKMCPKKTAKPDFYTASLKIATNIIEAAENSMEAFEDENKEDEELNLKSSFTNRKDFVEFMNTQHKRSGSSFRYSE